jgi:hypothetical protein
LLKVFKNRVLRKIFGKKRDEIIAVWRNCVMRSFITCTVSSNIFRMIK